MRRAMICAVAAVSICGLVHSAHSDLLAQTPAQRVDFVKDVQPIFQEHCYECHGPDKQMNGLRLDRRRDAMRGGTIFVIGPGNSAASRLYLRLIGTQFGEQMPKDDRLTAAQIQTIKDWIDQGAVWPDDAANDPPELPEDARAVRAIGALRTGDRAAFGAMLAADPALANRRGPGGTTPLMEAALVGDGEAVRDMLAKGADPNVANDAGATPLMWAAGDAENTRRLIDASANVGARSADGRTAVMVASSRRGNAAALKLLLDRGASANVSAPWTAGSITALGEAALVGDAEMIALLVEHGARLRDPLPIVLAMRARCDRCLDLLLKDAPNALISAVAALSGPPRGPARGILPMLHTGADARTLHPASGLNLLMLAAASEAQSVETARALIDAGVDVNAQGPGGMTALALARRHGVTPLVDLLIAAGAKSETPESPVPTPSPAASAREAVVRSLPLLQRTDVEFMNRTGCVSCHHNSLTAVTVSVARSRGVRVDEAIAASQVRKIDAYVAEWQDRVLLAHGVPGDSDTMTYLLLGLAAERHAPDAGTEAMARFIRLAQEPDGSWHAFAHRPPIEASDIQVTAAAIKALRVYAPRYERAQADAAISRAVAWIATAPATSTEDLAFKVLGLAWSGEDRASMPAAVRALHATQRPDGGWSQLPWMESDAYATGEALVALVQAGTRPTDSAYRRGVRFLLQTQLADGSWFVRTRALPIQPYFETGFPHGRDQFISAAATNWATQALIYASRAKASKTNDD